MTHVAPWKSQEIKQLVDIITSKPVIGIVNITKIPSPIIQMMRKKLRGSATFKVSKNRLFRIAFHEASKQKPHIDDLIRTLSGQMAIIATDSNPFKLFREMEATKMKMPAKGGEKAPEEIVIRAGETQFKPGPIVGELQRAGIPAAIERGKVVIKNDKVLVKTDDIISAELASILKKLEIHPLTVGLDLCGVHEGGMVYAPSVLNIDLDAMRGQFKLAAAQSFNLAMNIAFITRQTAVPLIRKAHFDAFAVALEANIFTKQTTPILLSKANQQMLTLKNKIDAVKK